MRSYKAKSVRVSWQLDYIREPIIVRDAEDRVIYWNSCAEDAYGYGRSDVIGCNPHKLLRTEFGVSLESIAISLRDSSQWKGELVQYKKDGTALTMSSHWVLDRDENGTFRALYETNHDITQTKRDEEDLRQSKTLLAEAQSLSQTGAWEWDLVCDRWTLSKEWQLIHGCKQGTMNPSELLQIAHPEDQRAIIQAFENLRNGVAPYDMEHRIIRQDDKAVRLIQARGRFIRDLNGKVVKVYGFARDITERKQAERRLFESEQRVRQKLGSILSPDDDFGMLELTDIIDPAILQKLMEDFYGVARIPVAILDVKGRVLVGVGWQDICTKYHRVNPETCRHCLESDTQLSAGLAQGEFRMYKCKNNLRDVATPIIVGGQHVGNIFTGQFFLENESVDTEIFRAQARNYDFDEEAYLGALARVPRISRETIESGMAFLLNLAETLSQLGYSNIKLARLLIERDRLTDSIRKTTEDLKRSNRDLQEFAYAASHDLQEPLRIINGFLSLLKERYGNQLDERARGYITYAADAAVRMSNLIRDLLQFSRVESQGKELQITDCRQALEQAIANLERTISEIGATISFGDLPIVLSDPTQLMQLFQNLLSNALKFRSPERPCKIQISARELEDQWQLSVSDNGIGIEPQYQERIFSMFQRLHPSKIYQGTGIGLSICKRIIERQGGRIWVTSKPDEGSTFHFTLEALRESGSPQTPIMS